MLGNYKILKDMGSVKNILFKLLITLFLIALAYWILTGAIFTTKLFVNTPYN